MAELTADAILGASDQSIEKIDLPEWGGSAHIKTMTGIERDTWEVYAQGQMTKGINSKVNMRAKLVSLCLCDSTGKRLFTDQQVAALGEKSASVLDRIYEKAVSINKLSAEDIAELEKK